MKRIVFGLFVIGVIGLGTLSANTLPEAQDLPPAGLASDCGAVITITDNGSGGVNFTVTTPGNGNPYDGSEDTLIGVWNETAATTVSAIALSSSLDIFGLDGDGMCTYYGPGAVGTNSCSSADAAGTDPGDYSGEDVSFAITDSFDGTVSFNGGLAAGATQFFSLEDNIVGGVSGGGTLPLVRRLRSPAQSRSCSVASMPWPWVAAASS